MSIDERLKEVRNELDALRSVFRDLCSTTDDLEAERAQLKGELIEVDLARDQLYRELKNVQRHRDEATERNNKLVQFLEAFGRFRDCPRCGGRTIFRHTNGTDPDRVECCEHDCDWRFIDE